jgi:SAM-dependent methyltransferase
MTRHLSPAERAFPEVAAGGFTRWDGTVQFYTRVNALIDCRMTVLDLGPGRGGLHQSNPTFSSRLASLKGKVEEVIGLDIDQAVLQNPSLDRAMVYDGTKIPLDDDSVDFIVSDYVFEHVESPEHLAMELQRILRPGGWICARTPNIMSILVLFSAIARGRSHLSLLRYLQPHRAVYDVFPAFYRMNSISKIQDLFKPDRWLNSSYTWSPEPGYHGGSYLNFFIQRIYQWLKQPIFGGEVLMIFIQYRPSDVSSDLDDDQ